MAILGTFSGEGSLTTSEVLETATAEREGWAALRSLQGDPKIDVLRYETTGADPARGVVGTRSLVASLADLPVLYGDLTRREAEIRGFEYAAGRSLFEMFTDVEVKETDRVRYPATTGRVYRVVASFYDPHLGNCIFTAEPAPEV